MAERGVLNALPKLPGYDYSKLKEPATHAKGHGMDFSDGVPVVKPVENQTIVGVVGPSAGDAKQMVADFASKFPHWKSLDGKVMRFFGYFVEPVHESQIETQRVRKVCVQYYLVDATCAVIETPAVGNHGMKAGTLMARHMDPGVNISTLEIGNVVTIRSREIALVDCDAFTRDLFLVAGRAQPEPLDYPADAFEHKILSGPQPREPTFQQTKQALHLAVTMAAGRMPTTFAPEDRERSRQFYHGEQGVLQFDAAWEGRHFKLCYFLADGTLCVNSVKTHNTGIDPVAAFIKRSRIFRAKSLQGGATTTVGELKTGEYIDFSDLRTGQTVGIYSREFFLFDCDKFTRDYCASKGVDQPKFDVPGPTTAGQRQPKRIGCPSLHKEHTPKGVSENTMVLRFSAEHAHPRAEDVGRKFIVCFYMEDSTISIFEQPVRNSGHLGGKVFARSTVAGITSPAAFHLGEELRLAGITYMLTDTDERTKKYLADGLIPGAPGTDLARAYELLDRIRLQVTQKFARTTDAYRHFSGHAGIGFAELKRLFKECEIKNAGDDTIMTVLELADRDRDGVISLAEFIENVLKQSMTLKPMMTRESQAAYAEAHQERVKADLAEAALRKFITKLEARRAYILDSFRIVSDRSVDGLVGVDTFRQVVTDRLGVDLSPDELDALTYRFYHREGQGDFTTRRLSMRDFRRTLGF